MIEIRHLRKEYENVTPLRDVSVTINEGDIISVIGPSGTGKSTLIRCINLLDRPTSGEILVDGVNITDKKCKISKISKIRKKMGMVFQSFNLFGHLTVLENVMRPPMDLLGMKKQKAYERATELLRMVGLESKALNYPDELSGGQKQRIAIARTLSTDPDIILFDEPTSALDPTMVEEVQAVIRELASMGKTMMIVTHEMRFAREICNRVFYMDDGGIYEDGTPEQIFDNPQKDLTRRFIRRLKVFETEIRAHDFDFIGTVSELNRYGFKNQIPAKTIGRVQAAFEELCGQILLPVLAEPHIRFTVEYEEATQTATGIVRYNGKIYDPASTENTISWKIFANATSDHRHVLISEAPFTDRFTFKVR